MLSQRRSQAIYWAILGLIAGAGIFARFFEIDFNLPNVVAVDSFKFVGEASRMVTTGDWTPQIFQYPGLLTNLLALFYEVFGIQSAYGHYLTAHIICAIAGSLLMVATWYAARTVTAELGQLVAMGLAAVCVICVTQSRTPAPDILMSLFMTTAMALVVSEKAGTKTFALAGALAGLALGAKFTGFYVIPFIAVAPVLHWKLSQWPEAVKRAATALVTSAVVFLLSTPWFIFLFPKYREALVWESHLQRAGQIGRVQGGYFDFLFSPTITWEQPWLGTSILGTLGAPLLIAGLIALAAALSGRGGRKVAFYAVYIVLYLIAITCPGRSKTIRFLMPILPLFYVVIGWFAHAVIRRGFAHRSQLVTGLAGLATAVVLLIIPGLKTVGYLDLMRGPSTNALAFEWAQAHLEPGAGAFLSPFFVDNLGKLKLQICQPPQVGGRQYGLPEAIGPSPERDPIYEPGMIDQLRAIHARYVITNSYFDAAFSPVAENLRFFPRSVENYQAFTDRLAQEADVIYTVKGISEGRLGPDITIYELKRKD